MIELSLVAPFDSFAETVNLLFTPMISLINCWIRIIEDSIFLVYVVRYYSVGVKLLVRIRS